MASGDIIRLGANTGAYTGMDSFFGWAGAGFPYAGADDITISADTTWNDACGYKKFKKLTINAGVTLKVERFPFYIFCDELAGTGIIDASGPSGSSSLTPHPDYAAAGGIKTANGAEAQGGCGGGIILICTRLISGAVTIKANGGDGWKNTTARSTTGCYGAPGGGAIALHYSATNQLGVNWDGSASTAANGLNFLHPYGIMCGKGGSSYGGRGGGHGGCSSNYTIIGGGSGIAGGGGVNNLATPAPGEQPERFLVPLHLLRLVEYGCIGGGGGGAYVTNVADSNGAGGGGGGAIAIWYREKTTTPNLQANGGLASGVAGNGAAGATFLITV